MNSRDREREKREKKRGYVRAEVEEIHGPYAAKWHADQ